MVELRRAKDLNLKRMTAEAAVACGALLFLAPSVLLLLTALKPESEIVQFRAVLPQQATLANFRTVLGDPEEIPLARWFINSLLISSCATGLVLLVDSMAAFSLARLRPRQGRAILAGVVLTLMVPSQVLLVPVYLILNQLGWLDTPLALIVPAGAGAFGVFLLHQFMLSIPRELEDAAEIDGCSAWGVYRHVAVPLTRPALAALGIFTFIGSWNDLLGPLVFLDSVDHYTMPVGIALFQTSYFTEYGITLAASVIAVLPVFVAFLLFQRQITQGIALTGLRE